MSAALPVCDAAAEARRFSALPAPRVSPASWELAALVTLGLAMGLATSFVKLGIGVPGHAIVLSLFPLACGVSLVPRRFAATIMGGSATAVMLAAHHTGAGAIAATLASALFADLALGRARRAVGIHAAFLLAGLGGNAVAWLARGVTKAAGVERGLLPLAQWWAPSLVSYALCGALAGALSAAAWFRLSASRTGRAASGNPAKRGRTRSSPPSGTRESGTDA